MIKRVLLVAVVVACRRPGASTGERVPSSVFAPPAAPAQLPPELPAMSRACPLSVVPTFAWNHELFPGCPPPPFEDGIVCDGPCPTPCREAASSSTHPEVKHNTITYDDRGRWMATAYDGGGSDRCTYEGDHLKGCDDVSAQAEKLTRDDHGRLVHVESPSIETSYGYDARGDLVTIDDSALGHTILEYDDGHKLIVERMQTDTLRYAYDDQGRLVRRTADRSISPGAAYTYDPSGLRTQIVSDTVGGTETVTFEYDGSRRPTRIQKVEHSPKLKDDYTEQTDYEYCTP